MGGSNRNRGGKVTKPPDRKAISQSVKPKLPKPQAANQAQTTSQPQILSELLGAQPDQPLPENMDMESPLAPKQKRPHSPSLHEEQQEGRKKPNQNTVDTLPGDLNFEVGELMSDISDVEEISSSLLPSLPALSMHKNTADSENNNISNKQPESSLPQSTQTSTTATAATRTPNTSTAARLDLNTLKEIPQNARQVYLTSTDPQRQLTSINPFKLKSGIDLWSGWST
jgi:hypothetical protein